MSAIELIQAEIEHNMDMYELTKDNKYMIVILDLFDKMGIKKRLTARSVD